MSSRAKTPSSLGLFLDGRSPFPLEAASDKRSMSLGITVNVAFRQHDLRRIS